MNRFNCLCKYFKERKKLLLFLRCCGQAGQDLHDFAKTHKVNTSDVFEGVRKSFPEYENILEYPDCFNC